MRRQEVVVVVHRPGPEYLVLLRSPEDHGYWHLVAGGIERGERPDEAALRELGEETGLLDPVEFGVVPLPLAYRKRGSRHGVTVHPFHAEAPAGWEPVLNEEHVDYRWLSADDACGQLEFPEPRQAVTWVAGRLVEAS